MRDRSGPGEEEFKSAARRLTDIDVWAHIVQATQLETLMDKTAKDELRGSLQNDPPEITVANIYATLERFAADADMIFRRGIATCFSNLDRRFRSHTGWKLGSRAVLSSAFDQYGKWAFRTNHRDNLLDIERTFTVLDGKPTRMHPPAFSPRSSSTGAASISPSKARSTPNTSGSGSSRTATATSGLCVTTCSGR